ncbi:hypothetical protein NQ527_10585 [Eshraghiella crossota]|uniref:Uncharacterized protein n=1 Tax=Eshraghiella crossota DSM 2876 TaxID=511680 RepID=D4RZF1_9FIRM|nr:hypothetical protein [Butyrivibrio crossotus]EFF68559.1 hypothetical protein BUTYVIB_01217 [Butyrivibrio crossotus DSM 2876]UWO50354.1 hypothetical protein NQ527_10585 [Butyrivibrio crossotus]
MRKTISVIATVLFIIGTCGIIGGLAAKERVPIVIKKTVIEGAVNNNVIKFLEDKLGGVNVDEHKIRENFNDIEGLNNVVDYYVEAALDAIYKAGFSKIDITGSIDNKAVRNEIALTANTIVNNVMKLFNISIDDDKRLIISGIIGIGSTKLVQIINDAVNENMDIVTTRIRVEVKLYHFILIKNVRIALYVLTAVFLVISILLSDKEKRMLHLGRNITIAGAASVIVIIYNILRSNYNIKKMIGFKIPLGLNTYLMAGGIVTLAGLIILIAAAIKKKNN